MLFPTSNIISQVIADDLTGKKEIQLSVLRLDLLHPVVSGNKLFKLHFFLQNALTQQATGIITFGGAYSNHLLATAYACRETGMECVGIVRGEAPETLSHTLTGCISYGMKLKFVSRQQYDQKDEPLFLSKLCPGYENFLVIPEGGYAPTGAAGAALITELIKEDASHICCASGTATTLAGLLLGIKKRQQVIGLPVLKNMHDLEERIFFLTGRTYTSDQLAINGNYHFGGYAKKAAELIRFMNQLYLQHTLPTDFVYTGKMMFGIIDLIKQGFFAPGSKIVCVHTGGLQGNLSLAPGTLVF